MVLRDQLLNQINTLSGCLDEIEPRLAGPAPVASVVRRRRQGRVDPAAVPRIIQAYEAGMSMAELGRQYGVHESTICLLLQREGITSRGNAGVIHQKAAEVRELRARGWSLERLADRYGCSTTTVWRVLRTSES